MSPLDRPAWKAGEVLEETELAVTTLSFPLVRGPSPPEPQAPPLRSHRPRPCGPGPLPSPLLVVCVREADTTMMDRITRAWLRPAGDKLFLAQGFQYPFLYLHHLHKNTPIIGAGPDPSVTVPRGQSTWTATSDRVLSLLPAGSSVAPPDLSFA